jgi:hypothetical protein
LVLYPEEYKSIYKMDTCIPMFISALFTIVKLSRYSTNKEQRKYAHICIESVCVCIYIYAHDGGDDGDDDNGP